MSVPPHLLAHEQAVLCRAPVPPDRRTAYGPDPDQVIDFWYPAGSPAAQVLLVHGGNWKQAADRTHATPLAARLAAAGYAVALPEYRRGPGAFQAALDDVAAAAEAVARSAGGLPVLLAGHSAGGQLALRAAARRAPDAAPHAVLALAPIADLAARLAGPPARAAGLVAALGGRAVPPDADPVRRARERGPIGVRTLLLHAADDPEVPLSQSRAYAAADPSAELRVLPDGGHYGLIDPGHPACAAVLCALAELSR